MNGGKSWAVFDGVLMGAVRSTVVPYESRGLVRGIKRR